MAIGIQSISLYPSAAIGDPEFPDMLPMALDIASV
jgi:hypothetical protein